MKAATNNMIYIFISIIISIHAAREGGDQMRSFTTPIFQVFQSTPPVKAATVAVAPFEGFSFISIHAAREGGDFNFNLKTEQTIISIHAAREGGDTVAESCGRCKRYFNPRRP